MNIMDSDIGAFHWGACRGCKHCDPDEGGCDVAGFEWRDKLRIEWDAIYCGAREQREDSASEEGDHE